MSRTPRVSVVMPVYNGELLVGAAVDSVLAQSGLLEVLLHDDGSTDGTLSLLEHIARQDSRVTVSCGPNLGPAAARNHCLRRVQGEFVAFLDHDDLWPKTRMEHQIALLIGDPSADAVLGHTFIFEKLGCDGLPERSPRARRVLCGLLQAALFRTCALTPLGGFDPGLCAADDFDLLLRFVETGGQFNIDPEIAVFYRLHPDQWTASTRFAASQTVRALHRSLQRRRRQGMTLPEWRRRPGREA